MRAAPLHPMSECTVRFVPNAGTVGSLPAVATVRVYSTTVVIPPPAAGFFLLTEDGFVLVTESGERLLLE